MFFCSSSVFWCFSLPCGWWNVLGSGADSWQTSWAVEQHGSERVPWPCGWPRSGGCLATRRPRAGCTESQRMMDRPVWVPVGKPHCYFDLLFGQRSKHTLVLGFDWLLWLVSGVLGFEEKPFGFIVELFEFTLSPVLCVKCKSCKQLWHLLSPFHVSQMNSFLIHHRFHMAATIVQVLQQGSVWCSVSQLCSGLYLQNHRIYAAEPNTSCYWRHVHSSLLRY